MSRRVTFREKRLIGLCSVDKGFGVLSIISVKGMGHCVLFLISRFSRLRGAVEDGVERLRMKWTMTSVWCS